MITMHEWVSRAWKEIAEVALRYDVPNGLSPEQIVTYLTRGKLSPIPGSHEVEEGDRAIPERGPRSSHVLRGISGGHCAEQTSTFTLAA